MKLTINTSDSQTIKIKLNEEEFVADAREKRAQMLLPFIVETLKSKNLEFKDLTEIEVVTEGPSFTGIRVGVSVAQTIAYVLNIPVNGKDIKTEGLDIHYS